MNANYWKRFYGSTNLTDTCSDFCLFVINFFEHHNLKSVLDCGCGNGRDSRKLSEIYNVTAIDNCGFLPSSPTISYKNADFVDFTKEHFDLIYSRFTFHSISNEQQQKFIESIPTSKYVAIETRSNKSSNVQEYYGKEHYRNYTDITYIHELLTSNGFKILYSIESDGLAKYKNEDPQIIRILAYKQSKSNHDYISKGFYENCAK